MAKPYVKRSDILLEEERWYSLEGSADTVGWTATLDGTLSTGERVSISRTARHLGEASLMLEEAIKDLGWRIQ